MSSRADAASPLIDAGPSSTTVAGNVAGALVRHGIREVFGQSNPPALLVAFEDAGIRQVFYRTENAAGGMADGFARIANRISVVVVQNGPAAALVVAPMAEASKASVPMLVLVQEVPADTRDRHAFQELEHATLFAAVSKWTRRIDHPARVDDYLDMAITAATTGRPGPVVLLLPTDVLDLPTQPPRFPRTAELGAFPLDRQRPDAAAVALAAEVIANADQPVVIAGGGVHLSGAAAELSELQRIASLPVATTNMGKGAVAEVDPLSIGVAANITGRHGPAHDHLPLIAEADVVLLVGTRTNQNGTDSWSLTPPDATYIHLDVDGLEVGRTYESIRLAGDAKAGLADLSSELTTRDLSKRATRRDSLVARIADGRRRRAATVLPLTTSTRIPIAPERLLSELDALLEPEDVVVADASYASVWVASYLTAKAPGQRFLLPRGQAGLGWGLPLAIGAKLADPNARVVAIVGDGGFAHVWSELETLVREEISLTVMVLNNGLLGMQRHGENVMLGRTTTAIRFGDVDHAAIARAVGARGVSITDPDEIRPALVGALESPVATVLDVFVDPDAIAPVRAWDSHYDGLNR
jgi:acetolactate synthase-1/2/3 large subunit